MKAYATNFTFSRVPSAVGSPQTWTWAWKTGQTTSQLVIQDPALGFNNTQPAPHRLYWSTSQGISYLDYLENYQSSSLGSGPAEGTFDAPMMWGKYGPSPSFATALDNLEGQASYSASISRFGDSGCAKPL